MFLPIGDEPNPRGTPIVNYALMAANIAVFVLITLPLSGQPADRNNPLFWQYLEIMSKVITDPGAVRELASGMTAYDLFVFQHGYRPAEPQVQDLFASMFMHAGLMHLAGNMLFLWIYGDNVEARLGRLGYLASYLVTGVAAALFHGMLSDRSPVPTLGASGAISGVLGFYYVFFPRNQVRIFTVLFPFYIGVIRIRARVVLAFYLILDNLLPFLLMRSGTGVAYGAHIGGFIGGVLLAYVIRLLAPGGRLAGARIPGLDARESMPDAGGMSGGERVHQMMRDGDLAGAAQAYLDLLGSPERRNVPAEDALTIGDWLAAQGHHHAAMAVYSRLLADGVSHEVTARAHLGSGLVLLHGLHQPTAAFQHLLAAREQTGDPEVERMAEEALQAIRGMQKHSFRGL